ncbi:MAG: hypothetical protein HY649_12510 [Acidobacteria bacterium]|nr:hypothetical protein [Acidobacteriota bacterium]
MKQVSWGEVLRVQAPETFRLRWSLDEWKIIEETPATSTGLGIHFVDIPVTKQQQVPIRFTFFWSERERWENRDYEVRIL